MAKYRLGIRDYLKVVILSSLILLVIYIVIFGCGFLFTNLASISCGNNILDEIYSPDNQYKVVVFQSDCGATTRLHTNASVLKADQNISDLDRGNIFFYNEVVEVQATWNGNRSIQILYTPINLVLGEKKQFSYSGEIFEISYQKLSQS